MTHVHLLIQGVYVVECSLPSKALGKLAKSIQRVKVRRLAITLNGLTEVKHKTIIHITTVTCNQCDCTDVERMPMLIFD